MVDVVVVGHLLLMGTVETLESDMVLSPSAFGFL